MSRPMLRSVIPVLLLALAIAPAFGQVKPKPTAKPTPAATAKPTPLPVAKPAATAKPAPTHKLTDSELATRLHEMVRAKGVYLQRGVGGDFCRRLGSRPIGNCEVYQAEFSDSCKVMAVFYSNIDARKNALHLFITSYLEPSYVDDYRLGLDGKLERAVRRRGEASSRVAVLDAMPGFKRVMDFLRDKQEQLADVPDAKVVDDGSCPQGKVKRVPRDPKEAVCLDRARLEAQVR
jgi:hypothetical protein